MCDIENLFVLDLKYKLNTEMFNSEKRNLKKRRRHMFTHNMIINKTNIVDGFRIII